jgi:hypothetical protein
VVRGRRLRARGHAADVCSVDPVACGCTLRPPGCPRRRAKPCRWRRGRVVHPSPTPSKDRLAECLSRVGQSNALVSAIRRLGRHDVVLTLGPPAMMEACPSAPLSNAARRTSGRWPSASTGNDGVGARGPPSWPLEHRSRACWIRFVACKLGSDDPGRHETEPVAVKAESPFEIAHSERDDVDSCSHGWALRRSSAVRGSRHPTCTIGLASSRIRGWTGMLQEMLSRGGRVATRSYGFVYERVARSLGRRAMDAAMISAGVIPAAMTGRGAPAK